MKIVIIVQNMVTGGVARLIVDEINELERRGVPVWLIFFERLQAGNTLIDGCSLPSERKIYIPYPRLRSITGMFALVRLLRHIQPDVVFTHMWFANTVGRFAACIAGIPQIYIFEHSEYDTVKSRKQFMLDMLLQHITTRVIAVSDAVKGSLIRHRIYPKKITVIHNGVDLTGYTHKEVASSIRAELSVPAEAFLYIFVGRLIGDKGVDVLLRALAKLPQDIRLLVAGTGPEAAALQSLSHALGVSDRAYFLGVRNDVSRLLSGSDALVLPSRREGFGLVIIEAHAAGLPVIVTDFKTSSDVVRDGVDGLIVPRDDADALAAAMKKLATDTLFYQELARAAPQDLDDVSIVHNVDALLALARREP